MQDEASVEHIVVLTGAGISKESGLETFRDAEGLRAKHRIEDVCTPEALARDPALVNAFYNARRKQLCDGSVQPNPAHRALAEFAEAFAGRFTLITQNIDDLHERAGCREVIHMHGELMRCRCMRCEADFFFDGEVGAESRCPACGASALRPHVVFFGEMPLCMGEIMAALSACDVFVAIGTSGNVYPAAGFVEIARAAGARTVELNLEPSQGATLFQEAQYGLASEVVPKFFRQLRERNA